MEEECNKVIKEYPLLVWTTELEKDLNKRLKEDTLTSELISEDIMRYTAEIRDVPMEDFSDIDRYNNLIKEFHSKVDEYNSEIFSHNKKISDNKTKLQSILFDISNKTNKIKSIEEQYESTKQLLGKYKLEYTDVQDNASCSTC
jgi:chromosome segregation ATPase